MTTPILDKLRQLALVLCVGLLPATQVLAQPAQRTDYALAPGDTIRIQVYQNPDLTLETRISDSGNISYPLIGTILLARLSPVDAERRIADALQSGGFLQKPQVTVTLVQVRGHQVSMLGQVARPGRYPLEATNTRLSDMLATAGGALPSGDDVVIVSGQRDGQRYERRIDFPAIYLLGKAEDDITLQGGDVIYVHRAPVFYIYGEAQRPGSFRIERGMTVMQALAQGGGPTVRGSQYRLRLHRRDASGSVVQTTPELDQPIQADDVIYVKESIF